MQTILNTSIIVCPQTDTSERPVTRYIASCMYATGCTCCEACSVVGLLRHGKQVTH